METKNNQLEIKNFTIDAKDKFCSLFLSDKSDFARLLVIAEAPESAKKDISAIISRAEKECRASQEENLSAILEHTIKKINPAIKKLAQKDENINLLIAAFAGNKISLSKYGKIYACLCDKNEITAINTKNKKVSGTKKATPQKDFSETIDAELNENNKIIFLNDGFGNDCDQEKLQLFAGDGSDGNFAELKNCFQNTAGASEPIAFVSLEIKKQPLSKTEDTETEKLPDLKQVKTLSLLLEQGKNLAIKIKGLSHAYLSNKKNKYLAIIIILLSAIIGIYAYRNASANSKFNSVSEIIGGKKMEAAALISANKNFEAVNKLLEAKNIYLSAATDSPAGEKMQERWGNLAGDIENELNKAGRIEKIAEPEKIAELSNFGIKFIPQTIFKSENQIIITGSDFGLAYRIDLETKQRGFNFFSTTDDKIIQAAKSSDLMLFFSANKKGYYYFPATKKVSDFNFEKQEWEMAALSEKFIDILDEKENQIKRLARGNLAAVEKINLENKAKSIASDSQNIFALLGNNEIMKISGNQQEKAVDLKIMPLLEAPDIIITNQGLENFYTVNKKQEQIAVFAKNGQFIKQYNIENMGEIIDLFIDSDKEIFILTADGVYKITINL